MGAKWVPIALLSALQAGACLAQDNQYGPEPAPHHHQAQKPPNASQFGAPRSQELVTPAQSGSKSLITAAEAPLHQLNLISEKIPPVLLAAMTDPYARPRPLTCKTLAAAVDELTVAMGPDYDHPSRQNRKVTASGGTGLQLANSAAGSVLPYGGLIGLVSGASRHDAQIMRALNAGGTRRGYLKGLGESRRCPDPASPTHLQETTSVHEYPRYPRPPVP